MGMKNFSRAWITGSSNHKTSNILDHATSEQHRVATICVYAEAAKATNQPIRGETNFNFKSIKIMRPKTQRLSVTIYDKPIRLIRSSPLTLEELAKE